MQSRINGDKLIDGLTDRLNSQNTNRDCEIVPTIPERREENDYVEKENQPSKNSKGVKTIKPCGH